MTTIENEQAALRQSTEALAREVEERRRTEAELA